ncbi:MAG: hypothetical protein JXQ75_02820 [Phycisphaerae bacterium]|nr:hypothetical protein [Phycisphaerae bacterium]
MTQLTRIRFPHLVVLAIVLGFLCPNPVGLRPASVHADGPYTLFSGDDGPSGKMKKKKKKKKEKGKKKDKGKDSKSKKNIIRWGKRRNESNKEYDKRYAKLLKRIRQDKKGDFSGGTLLNESGEQVRFYTKMGHPFICRSDISTEFTANLAMYMEMLHREYRGAFAKILTVPPSVSGRIEVIVWSDRANYVRNGGSPSSGGYFDPFVHLRNDRGPAWPARHYRLVQFTDGVTDFSRWPKGTLKHEAAHMELQLRLGFTTFMGGSMGFPVVCPIWWNEGVATIFEDWDFDLTLEENIAEIPKRGRYAPFIRRMHGTEDWKDFDWVWMIDPATWNSGVGGTDQVFLNYCQAWSLVAYMFNGGTKGCRDFRKIYDLTKRVGTNSQQMTANRQVVESRAWLEAFPKEDRAEMEKNWSEWVAKNINRDSRVPDEEYWLRARMIKPDVVDKLERFSTEEEKKANSEWVEKESEKRKNTARIEK